MRGITKRTTKGGEVRWDAVWDEPSADGNRKQRKKTFRTKKEAERFRTKTMHELHSGAYIQPSTTTVADYLEEWVKGRRNELEASSFLRYQGIVRGRLIPGLGQVELAKLTPLAVQRYYKHLEDDGVGPSSSRCL